MRHDQESAHNGNDIFKQRDGEVFATDGSGQASPELRSAQRSNNCSESPRC
jgi:hypothetical protein